MNSNSFKFLFFLVFIIGLLINVGCTDDNQTSKQEQPNNTKPKKEVVKDPKVEKPVVKKEEAPNIVGVWTGKFDSREATLSIVEQKETQFKGTISVKYRNVSKQEVEGTIDIGSKNISMKDILHSRSRGTYSAKLSDDSKSMGGVFTMDLDGKKLKFNLNKKQ